MHLLFPSVLVGYNPYSTLSDLIATCTYILFKMPTIRQIWQHIQQGNYVFCFGLKNVYLHLPVVKNHHHFLHFVWQHKPYQWKVLPFGLGVAPRVVTLLTKPILFLYCHKVFCIIIYLDDILVLTFSKCAGKRTNLVFSIGSSWITY